jgi:hypothetical protein
MKLSFTNALNAEPRVRNLAKKYINILTVGLVFKATDRYIIQKSHFSLTRDIQLMKTPAAKDPHKEFTDLPVADRVIILESLDNFLERRMLRRLEQVNNICFTERAPLVH